MGNGMSTITIYRARQIITMNPSNPVATHVAVREGHILGAGELRELEGWGPYLLDETSAEHVLVPGFVEAHAHAGEGLTGIFPLATYFDRNRSRVGQPNLEHLDGSSSDVG